MSPEVFLPGEVDTEKLGERLAMELRPGVLILLVGPLGAGKTTLVRGLVRGLGGDPAEVCSPTFILRESYQVNSKGGIVTLHHLDLYRLRGKPQAAWDELGLWELLEEPGAATVVEWPEELAAEELGLPALQIQLFWHPQGRTALWRWLGNEPTS